MNVGYYLLFDRIEIQAANAISSPITYGFPAITGFLGAIHALSRTIPTEQEIQLDGVLIASHDCQVQAFRPHDFADYTFNQSRNPIKKSGDTASIIEEGSANLIVSLLIEVKVSRQSRSWLADNQGSFLKSLQQRLMQQRIAGGSVQSIDDVALFSRNTSADEIQRALLPAFVLVNAQEDLTEITRQLQKQTPEATALDALIDVATLHHTPQTDDKNNTTWDTRNVKTGRGWLVPIPVGFQGIAPAFDEGELANCRNPEYPSQYTESVYSLGKWVFPYRLGELTNCFWRYHTADNLFLATQS